MRKSLIAACGGILVAGLAHSADARLVIDLRLADWDADNEEFVVREGEAAKAATVYNVGDKVYVEVYAQVFGNVHNATARERLQSIHGSFLSQGAAVFGNMAPAGSPDISFSFITVGVEPFNGAGSTAGRAQDLDGDGDLDLGGFVGGEASDFGIMRAASPQTTAKFLTTPATRAGWEWLVGRIEFEVTGAGDGEFTDIVFQPRRNADGSLFKAAFLYETDVANAAYTLYDGDTAQLEFGEPVRIFSEIPEPGSMMLLGLGSLLLGRRRR